MYRFELPKRMLQDLWKLKTYCGAPSIAQQVRDSVKEHLRRKEIEIGTTIEDAAEAIEKYREKESKLNS